MSYSREKLGALLVAGNVIDEGTLEEALGRQSASGTKLGEVLVESFGVTEERIAATLATQKGLEHVRLGTYPVDREAAATIEVRLAQKRQVIPVAFRDGVLVLAMADPLDIEAMDEVRLTSGRGVIAVVATPTDISNAIERHMVSADAFHDVEISFGDDVADVIASGPQEESEDDVPIVRLVNQIIREAVIDRASDVHFEPEEDGVRVRYRIDGVLHEITRLPRKARAGVTSRIKVMADMDIAERRLPQDGRAAIMVDGTPVDLRIATLPTPYGETVTIRVLHEGLAFRTLELLGMAEEDRDKVCALLDRPHGCILHAGPTGSGKTTSLYAALGQINESSRKIITIEDPIEYRMDGITQMAVRPKIGLSFAAGLRTILRADPDVVMIGEMRDPETAEIGVRAALTGHLVLSSIHTNDAPSALTRLADMNVPPYITSSALLGVVSQRLARQLCPECLKEHEPTPEELAAAGIASEEAFLIPTISEPNGCDQCKQTGYRGRVGLYEIMVMSDELRRLFLREASSEELRVAALRQGMKSLRLDGLEKVAKGLTSLSELARVST